MVARAKLSHLRGKWPYRFDLFAPIRGEFAHCEGGETSVSSQSRVRLCSCVTHSHLSPDSFAMKIEHMAFNVADALAMSRWYVEHLGFSVKRGSTEPPFAHFLADDSGTMMLELYSN